MLNRRFLLSMLLPVFAVLPGTQAGAADVTLSGKVTAAACTVTPVLVAGQLVDLGTVGRTRFQRANDAGDWVNFSLNLTNCPAGTTMSTATFTGTPDSTDATLFANTEPAATAASHMAIQMAKETDHSVVLSNNSTLTVNVDASAGSATFPLAARMYSPAGGVEAGKVSSSVLVNFTYQ